MTTLTQIRVAELDDYDVLGEIMFEAIHHGRGAYSAAQRTAWCSKPRTGEKWIRRLGSQTVFVAWRNAEALGFMSLADAGYIDFAYIRPSAQGSGLFRRLYQSIEQIALSNAQSRLWVHASLIAQPAFSAIGFAITKREAAEIDDQSLDRFEMEKQLAPHSAEHTQ